MRDAFTGLGILAAIVATVAVIVGISIGGFFLQQEIRRWIAPTKGETEVVEFRESGENRIAKYDYFFKLCSSIQALEDRMEILRKAQANYQSGTDDYNYYVRSLVGVEAARQEAIRTYNQDAEREYTGAQFRDSDLPFYIDPAPYTGQENTLCALPD